MIPIEPDVVNTGEGKCEKVFSYVEKNWFNCKVNSNSRL